MSTYSKDENNSTGAPKLLMLTPFNYEDWKSAMESKLIPTGPEGVSIVGGIKPATRLMKPCLDQKRYDADKVEIPNQFRFKSIVRSKDGEISLDPQGKIRYAQTDAHMIEYQKAIDLREIDILRVEANVSKCAVIITDSLSTKSVELMKAVDINKYWASLADPVALLAFIDITHRVQNDAGIINTVKNLFECKQSSFNGDFHAWLADFCKCYREYCKKLNPTGNKDVQEALDKICKAHLTLNCDRIMFRYILDKLNSEAISMSYAELVTSMTNYAKNNPSELLGKSLVTVSQKPKSEIKNSGSNKPLKMKDCPECGRRFMDKKLKNNEEMKICKRCFFDKKYVEDGDKKNATTTEVILRTPASKSRYNNSERVKDEQEKLSASKQLINIRTESMRNIQDEYETYEGDI